MLCIVFLFLDFSCTGLIEPTWYFIADTYPPDRLLLGYVFMFIICLDAC